MLVGSAGRLVIVAGRTPRRELRPAAGAAGVDQHQASNPRARGSELSRSGRRWANPG